MFMTYELYFVLIYGFVSYNPLYSLLIKILFLKKKNHEINNKQIKKY